MQSMYGIMRQNSVSEIDKLRADRIAARMQEQEKPSEPMFSHNYTQAQTFGTFGEAEAAVKEYPQYQWTICRLSAASSVGVKWIAFTRDNDPLLERTFLV